MIPDISNFIARNKQDLYKTLEDLVLIQSFSRNKAGVDRVGKYIQATMTDMGFACEFSCDTELGNTLIARSPGAVRDSSGQILITGHMDTVFPQDTSFNWYKEDDTRCYGPGVADMKGGLVVGIFALKALVATAGLKNLPVTFIFNSDEEIGSPASRPIIAREAKRARMGYVLEAGGMNNEIVTGRKGNLSVEMTVKGKAGHAAFAGTNKASAILEMAHKTIAIEALNRPEKGVSANVGTVSGGMGPNTVPDLVSARLDFRFLDPADEQWVKAELDTIANKCTVSGTTCTTRVVSGRPPMPQTRENQQLFDQISRIATGLETPVLPQLRQGVSDANIIAQQGIAVIDGLGPAGEKDHSEDEYILKDSLWERTVLFANILALI